MLGFGLLASILSGNIFIFYATAVLAFVSVAQCLLGFAPMSNGIRIALVAGLAITAATAASIYFSPQHSCVRMLASRGLDRSDAESACDKETPRHRDPE
jgi:hypothetical protein